MLWFEYRDSVWTRIYEIYVINGITLLRKIPIYHSSDNGFWDIDSFIFTSYIFHIQVALEKHSIGINELNVKVRLGGTEALKNFLIESESLGFLPRRSVIKELKNGELTQIQFDGLFIERSFYFIQRKGETSERNKKFIYHAKKVYNK